MALLRLAMWQDSSALGAPSLLVLIVSFSLEYSDCFFSSPHITIIIIIVILLTVILVVLIVTIISYYFYGYCCDQYHRDYGLHQLRGNSELSVQLARTSRAKRPRSKGVLSRATFCMDSSLD